MKQLLKVAVAMALIFASTFLLLNSAGLVTEEGVTAFVQQAHRIHPAWMAVIVVGLLSLDLLIAIPTMTTVPLAGYFMGPVLGGTVSAMGLMNLGLGGYGMGFRFGRPVLARLFKDDAKFVEIEQAFAKNDLLTLFACQALSILPEFSCTLAGIARMRFRRFLSGYAVGVVPFAFIVAWAGSIRTLSNAGPAIYTAIAISLSLLRVWTLIRRRFD